MSDSPKSFKHRDQYLTRFFGDIEGVELTEADFQAVESAIGFKFAELADAAQDVRDVAAQSWQGRLLLRVVDGWVYLVTWGGRL